MLDYDAVTEHSCRIKNCSHCYVLSIWLCTTCALNSIEVVVFNHSYWHVERVWRHWTWCKYRSTAAVFYFFISVTFSQHLDCRRSSFTAWIVVSHNVYMKINIIQSTKLNVLVFLITLWSRSHLFIQYWWDDPNI